jgi:hypothetical protein
MIDSDAVQHCERVGQRSFETVVAAFEAEFATLPSLPNQMGQAPASTSTRP